MASVLRAALVVAASLGSAWYMARLAWEYGSDPLFFAIAGGIGGFLLSLLALRLTREAPRT